MPATQVKIVNANGQIGYVAATYPPYVRGDLADAPAAAGPLRPGENVDDIPARNASRDTWADYAHRHGLTPEQVEPMSRDELVAHYTAQEG